MQVYKAFFKIIKKNLPEISIYIVVFLFFAVFLSSVGSNKNSEGFNQTKSKMVFINNDKDSKLIEGLKDYLNENARIVDVENNTQKLQDALFFREVEYILTVPEGFSQSLLSGNEIQLEKTTVPDSATGMYIDLMINKYLNTAKIYKKNLQNISDEQLINHIKEDLSNETHVNVNSFNSNGDSAKNYVYYFNYLSYSIFAVLILGVCAVMLVFNNSDLRRRNISSPIKLKSINFQLVLGNFSFAILSWIVMISSSFILYKEYMLTFRGFLLLLNSLIFTFAALSISFLIANVVKSRNAMSAAANVVALGSSFISGVFVPQEMLGKTVLTIASFTPTYWFIKANNDISDIARFNMENVMPIINSMLVILAFATASLSVALVIIKQKRTSA